MQAITDQNAFFWQFWVPGAPCNLSHNINCDLALVNGAPMTTHSLTFSDPNEFHRIQSLSSGPNALPFGTEIEIDVPLALKHGRFQVIGQQRNQHSSPTSTSPTQTTQH